MLKISFGATTTPFFRLLKSKVNEYFTSAGKPRNVGPMLFFKGLSFISHVHNPRIKKRVRQTCMELEIAYLAQEHAGAFTSPLTHLKKPGQTGSQT
jgi:hypothetical protein